MQEDNSLSEKILSDIECIINSDDQLKDFSIVPVPKNEKNKSPVLYEEHNLGLEMWCVKHVYKYAHTYLLKVRGQLKKNRLSQCQMEKLNKLLIGAILIQPDVTTFWNMRRELIENDAIGTDREMLLTKLVLSYKSKSNEAFSHRRWIVRRLLKNLTGADLESRRLLASNEFAVTRMAAQKAQNNYHAWTHRMWSLRNIAPSLLPAMLVSELDFSLNWIYFSVSEHTGYHYRQRLFTFLKSCGVQGGYFSSVRKYVKEYLHLANSSGSFSILNCLFGQTSTNVEKSEMYQNYFCLLLHELTEIVEKLNKLFPTHESIWYHRRFVVHALLHGAYEYYGLDWQHKVVMNDSYLCDDVNIVSTNLSESSVGGKFQENGEKCPKLFKSEPNVVESCLLYKVLVKIESEFILANSSNVHNSIQTEYCKRHEKWLKSILGINCTD